MAHRNRLSIGTCKVQSNLRLQSTFWRHPAQPHAKSRRYDQPVTGVGRYANGLLENLTGRRLMRPPRRSSAPPPAALDKHAVYAAMAEIRRRNLEPVSPSAPINLSVAELKVFSQNGEDGIIAELVRCLPVESRYFVEFGVEDGTECNTRLLSEAFDWSGPYLEPDATAYKKLPSRWSGSETVAVAQETVTSGDVAELFQRDQVPEILGLLPIDVDGQDYWIWEALPARYRPAIVVIECNTSYRPGISRVEERGLGWTAQHSDTFGASKEALGLLGQSRGHSLVRVDLAGVNAFFVRHDLLQGRNVNGVTTGYPNYDLRGYRHPTLPVRPTVTPQTPRSR